MKSERDLSGWPRGNRLDLNLEKRVGETPKDYHERLLAIYSTQIGLISKYEIEKELDRYRTTDRVFKDLLENRDEEDVGKAKQAILTLQEEVESYRQNYPQLSRRKSVQEKLKDLKSIT